MSRGFGKIEHLLLEQIPAMDKATLTLPTGRSVQAVAVIDLAAALFGQDYSRAQYVSMVRAVKELFRAGRVKLLRVRAINHQNKKRVYLFIELIPERKPEPVPPPVFHKVDLMARWLKLHPEYA